MKIYSECCPENLRKIGATYSHPLRSSKVICTECHNLYEITIKDSEIPHLDEEIANQFSEISCTFTPESFATIIEENRLKRIYRNEDCPGDCQNISQIATTDVDPGIACGEGEYEALIKCSDCNSLYFVSFLTDVSFTDQMDVHNATRYTGCLDEEILKEEIRKMFRRINQPHLKTLEDKCQS